MMRILYDHQAFSTHRYGGISRYFHEIANLIARDGRNHVEIFAPLYVNEYFRASDDLVVPSGWYVPEIPKSLRIIRALDNFASVILRGRRDVDIFHETYYSLHDFCPRSAKRIVTVHDMIHERLPQYFRRDDDTPQVKAHAVKRADHVICVSENTRRDLIELLGVPREKTTVVHHGYVLTAQAASFEPETGGKPYILYVGHRNAFRNFERLLRAYAQSAVLKNDFVLLFFGGGELSANEHDALKSLSLTGANVMHLSGGDDILAALYSNAAAFVYPSLYEGFGIPPLEAMSYGCPVVCSNVSSIPEVVGDAAELFNPEDEHDMRGALERVVLSEGRASMLTERGYARCKLFSWEKCANETLDVYKRALF